MELPRDTTPSMKTPPASLAAAVIVCGLALVGLARVPIQPAPDVTQRQLRPAPSELGVSSLRDGKPLDLNRASAGDLLLLPGVGPKLAQRIVAERARRSGFGRLDELLTVKGVGPKTLAKLRPLLRVDAPPAPGVAEQAVTAPTATQPSATP